ncbi:MAG: carboxypeptidase regulatory-like domain-containing protein [Chloroflexi bacterium]|nr:carboxypeptidase regulatory-like domain-containing protein [Chloroflexota bacterium]
MSSLRVWLCWGFVGIWLLGAVAACQGQGAVTTTAAPAETAAPEPLATPYPQARVHWQVTVPPNTPPDATVELVLLDEVTGLEAEPLRYAMQSAEPGRFTLALFVDAHQRLTYRYALSVGGQTLREVTPAGEAVRYRSALALPEEVLMDQVARWEGLDYALSPPGRLQGRLLDAATHEPIPDVFVFAGGMRTLTDARGEFLLEGLAPGLHTVLLWHPDGRYRPFQQQAQIAAEATTPVDLTLQASEEVPVKFLLTPPEDTVPGSPVRLVGDLYRLGNTYADLPGGQSVLAGRAPQMQARDDGRYEVVLTLPVGVPVRYKYTLGDGLTNAERTAQGLRVRHLWLEGPAVLEDRVSTWRWPGVAPVWLEVTVAALPPGERVSVQFRPVAESLWHSALPMWPLANGHWGFLFYGPMHPVQATAYRYCRNEQCRVAVEGGTLGQTGRLLRSSALPQNRHERVDAWHWYQPLPQAPQIVAPPIAARGPEFVTGVAWVPDYAPHWQPHLPAALDAAQAMHARTVVLQPRWTATGREPYPVFGPVVGEDPLTLDLEDWMTWATARDLQPWLYPRLRLGSAADAWWNAAPVDSFAWWQVWFERYRRFVLHFARLAQQGQAAALVLGGPEIAPALPGGTLPDGRPAQILGDADTRWRDLLAEVRTVYSGPVWWAVDGRQTPAAPPFADALDGLYLRWEPPRTDATAAEALAQAQAAALDAWQPVAQETDLPVVLAVAFPSAQGALTGCPRLAAGPCLPAAALRPNAPAAAQIPVDLDAQMALYQALLPALESRPWVQGVLAADFYPPVTLHDPSASVHGKPAAALLWYWFDRWQAAP